MINKPSLVTEAKTPAEQAHELGLVHAGWGYWKNTSGKIVARTIGPDLVKIEDAEGEIPGSADGWEDWYQNDSLSPDDEYADQLSKEGSDALVSLSKLAFGAAGITVYNADMLVEMGNIICEALEKGNVDEHPFFEVLDPDEVESVKDYLTHLVNGKNKLVARVAVWKGQKKEPKYKSITDIPNPDKDAEEDEPDDEPFYADPLDDPNYVDYQDPPDDWEPPDDNDVIFDPEIVAKLDGLPFGSQAYEKKKAELLAKKGTDNQSKSGLDMEYISNLLGITPQTKGYEDFIDYMNELEKAETAPAVNYISQKMKKAGFVDKESWKKLHKYIKSVKDIQQGPKVPGKIKNKQACTCTPAQLKKKAYKATCPIHGHLAQDLTGTFDKPTEELDSGKYLDYDTAHSMLKAAAELGEIETIKSIVNATDVSLFTDSISNVEYWLQHNHGGNIEKAIGKIIGSFNQPNAPHKPTEGQIKLLQVLFKQQDEAKSPDHADIDDGETSPFPKVDPNTEAKETNAKFEALSPTKKAYANKALEIAAKKSGVDMTGWTYPEYMAFAVITSKGLDGDQNAFFNGLEAIKNVFQTTFPEEFGQELSAGVGAMMGMVSNPTASKAKVVEQLAKESDPSTWDEKTKDDTSLALSHLMSEVWEATGKDLEIKSELEKASILKLIKMSIEAPDDISSYNTLRYLKDAGVIDEDALGHLDKMVTKIRYGQGKSSLALGSDIADAPDMEPVNKLHMELMNDPLLSNYISDAAQTVGLLDEVSSAIEDFIEHPHMVIQFIKELRASLGLSLKEAKEIALSFQKKINDYHLNAGGSGGTPYPIDSDPQTQWVAKFIGATPYAKKALKTAMDAMSIDVNSLSPAQQTNYLKNIQKALDAPDVATAHSIIDSMTLYGLTPAMKKAMAMATLGVKPLYDTQPVKKAEPFKASATNDVAVVNKLITQFDVGYDLSDNEKLTISMWANDALKTGYGENFIHDMSTAFSVPTSVAKQFLETYSKEKGFTGVLDFDKNPPTPAEDMPEKDEVYNNALDIVSKELAKKNLSMADFVAEEQKELEHAINIASKSGDADILIKALQSAGVSGTSAKFIGKEVAKLAYGEQTPTTPEAPKTPTSSTDDVKKAIESEMGDDEKIKKLWYMALKAADTSMLPGKWAKGDAGKVIGWLDGKVKKEKSPMGKEHFQKIAMGLVLNHGVSLADVPDELIPDSMKHLKSGTSTGALKQWSKDDPGFESAIENWQSADAASKPAVEKNILKMLDGYDLPISDVWKNSLDAAIKDKGVDVYLPAWIGNLTTHPAGAANLKYLLQKKYGEDTTNTPIAPVEAPSGKISFDDAKAQSLALAKSFDPKHPGDTKQKMLDLLNKSDIPNQYGNAPDFNSWLQQIHGGNFEQGLNALMTSAKFGNLAGAGWGYLKSALEADAAQAKKDIEQKASYEKAAVGASSELDKSNPAAYAESALNDAGFDYASLSDADKKTLEHYVKKAFDSTSEAGVGFSFAQLKKKLPNLPQSALENMQYEILQKSVLSTDPNAFKDFFEFEEPFNEFMAANPAFANNLSPEEKQKMLDAMKVGMMITDDPGTHNGYAKAKEYYQNNLVGTIPGFDEGMFKKWRTHLKNYHDQVKSAAAQATQLKSEWEAKKKAEEEAKKEYAKLQAALDALGTGDTKKIISGIMSATGLSSQPAATQQKAMKAIASALTAPNSQEMLDAIDTLRGHSSYASAADAASVEDWGDTYGTNNIGGTGLDKQHWINLRKLVANAWSDLQHPAKSLQPEPKSLHSPETRAKHVFDQWLNKYGMTIGHVPNTAYGERKSLVNAVISAIKEPDPAKVNGHLNSLLITNTSLNDKQISQLKKLVQQEREIPASTQGKSDIFPGPKMHSAQSPTPIAQTSSGPVSSLTQNEDFTKKLKYYGISLANSGMVAAIEKTIGTNTNQWNRQSAKNKLLNTLTGSYGMPVETARRVALWATKEAMTNSELHQQAAKLIAQQTGAVYQPAASFAATTDQTKAKATVANLPAGKDPHGVIKAEWVPGEQIKLYSSSKFELSAPTPSHHWEQTAKVAQENWRKQNVSSKDLQHFNEIADRWQGSSQWGKVPSHRKAANHVLDKIIEGPPPMTLKMDSPIERGMAMAIDDFKEYIKAFRIGEPTYIGPSGFSAKRSIALGFGGMSEQSPHDPNRVCVLLRIKPPKSGAPVKAASINRSDHGFTGEQEIIAGTNRNTVTKNVIKHVTTGSGGQLYTTYEIELEYDDTITEIIKEGVGRENYGFRTEYWKGLSPATVKALIKYNNSSVRHIAK